MPLGTSLGGHENDTRALQVSRQLGSCAVEPGAGGLVLDSSTGFRMSTDAVRCSAGRVSQARFDAATTTHPNDFFPGAPDVAIEIVSPSDQWSRVTAKIEIYAREGAQYSVAIDPRKARCFALGALPDGIMLDIDAFIRDGK